MSGQKTIPIKVSWQTTLDRPLYHITTSDNYTDDFWAKYMFWLVEQIEVFAVFIDGELAWNQDKGWVNDFVLIKAAAYRRHPTTPTEQVQFVTTRWREDIHAPSPWNRAALKLV